ncbi:MULTISPECIES: glycosyltransferase family 4 protein [Kitasatospora]|uniref:Putative glycosyltransferase n=1 Tax=Kitasatospora setae (strain ATCC 33774 / DSM 43861 / JCM 3304 / KCC A-0304 / NBRC 14216 / KM-6054) TaxID=452652 RepID=E4N125_KITSK|nr:glycosyltransferase family 4 protein [Kitasatospora setae]BAJ31859.1 putative glycosyltransferase [Kitasatospora setae KM-6054]
MGTTLIVTNDFPPRQGGIETFVHALAVRLSGAGEGVVVLASDEPGAAEFDAGLPFPVVREPVRMLLPTARVAGRAAGLMARYGCDRVWFGAAAPLGALGPAVRRAGAERVVATTHGHEVWWARAPLARRLLRRVGASCDTVTYLGEFTRRRIAPALGPGAAGMARLVPGVDPAVFRPSAAARAAVRGRYGLGRRPVVLCVARLVPRKGQDVLLRALPLIRRRVPDAVLLLVGAGPDESRLRRLARRCPPGSVVFAGGHGHRETAAFYAAADVFAMPCRTRRLGLEAEGLGIVFLEASASGLPVVAGRSGGAPDAVRPGRTGTVVDGRRAEEVAEAVLEFLEDPDRAREFGRAGREWVTGDWSWDASARRLAELLSPTPGDPARPEWN